MTTLDLACVLDPHRVVNCSDCAWSGTAKELRPIVDIQERLYPGEEVPAGECPDCGALAHVEDD